MLDFDKTIRPQDDFFGYVNKNWLNKNPIPPDEVSWGTFYVLRDKSAVSIQKIIAEFSSLPENDLTHDQKLIKNFFETAMSYSKFNKSHLDTLNSELRKIREITDKEQIPRYMGRAHRYNFSVFWENSVSLDDKNSQIQVLRMYQGGLTLPNRDYYLDTTGRMKQIRNEYKKFFDGAGDLLAPRMPDSWDNVFSIENRLAKASWTEVELRDVEKNYTRFTITQLSSLFPSFNWQEYFKESGWKNPSDNIVIDQPPFFDEVFKIINESPLEEIKEYLSWQVINSLVNWVSEEFTQLHFNFYGRIISGKQKDSPTWKRAVLQADTLIIGEALGREYAARHFPETSKKAVLGIVDDIRSAYHKRIDQVTWMQEPTKKLAHKKLDNIKVLIGYPSIWHDLSKLEFCDDNHLLNMLTARGFFTDLLLDRVGQKPPVENWQMNAHTVNAYFNPNELVICFPAAILQPPFFDPAASYATNLGGIGSVIGHEFTHGFDDQGAEFDDKGNVARWQTDSEKKAFKSLANNLAKQADSYQILPGIFLKGKLILGEAIADIGGVELATEALSANTNKEVGKKDIRDLLINYAVTERGAQREEFLIQMAKIDPHPPSPFRVNCTLQHVDEFYKAFDVKPNDKLYLTPEKRVNIW